MQRFFTYFQQLLTRFSKKTKNSFTYVALGDSAVEGIGASLPERSYTGIIHEHLKLIRKNTKYYNLGKAFATIGDVNKNQLEKAIALQPQLITISIGANDIKQRTPLKEFEKNLRFLLENLKSCTQAAIIINTIPDLSHAPAVPKKFRSLSLLLVKRLNSVIKKLTKSYHITLVDIYVQSSLYTKQYPEVISKDGLHPSDFGYAIWANTIISEIRHILYPSSSTFSVDNAL